MICYDALGSAMRGIFFVVLCLLLSGCVYKTRYAGVLVRETDLKQIRIGESTKQDVYRTLGAPTFLSIEDPNNVLHYASYKMKIAPDRTGRIETVTIYTMHFDQKAVLTAIKKSNTYTNIPYNKEATPAVYKRASFIEEFLASSAARFR